MDKPPPKVQSFIVKLWLDESSNETRKAVWHGHITHVPGGERRYLKRLRDIEDFIERYRVEMGVKRRLGYRFAAWFRQWTKRL